MELVIQVIFGSVLGLVFLYFLIRAIINAIQLLVEVHQEGLLHEISCILLPFYSLYYVFMHKTEKRTMDYLGAVLLSLVSLAITVVSTMYIWISPLAVYMIIGWVNVFRDAFQQSTLKGVLALLLPPYGFYYVLKEKEDVDVFDFVYYFAFYPGLTFLIVLLIQEVKIDTRDLMGILPIPGLIILGLFIIACVIGWFKTVMELKATSRKYTLLDYLPPVTLKGLIEQIKNPDVFQIIFYVGHILLYGVLLVLVIYLLTLVAIPVSVFQFFLYGAFGLLTIAAVIGYINILKAAFQDCMEEGLLCLLIPLYANRYVLKKKVNVNLYDVLFFIHQIILYTAVIILLFPLFKNPFFIILIILRYASIMMLLYCFIITIMNAFKKSVLYGILSLIVPFYWIYYAIAKMDQDYEQYNLIKWGFSIAFPIFLLFQAV